MTPRAAADPKRRLGQILAGRYRLERLLGRGGMGAVYEAMHIEIQRRVAVKVLLGDAALRPDLVARMRREARAAARIGHPNIAQVFDFGIEPDGVAFLVQELLIGEDLDARLGREPRLSPHVALEIVTPVMGALVAAHRHGVTHRDIKAANIFLAAATGGGQRVVLLDFGLAKLLDARASQALTSAGAVMGTPGFMAPEQLRGDSDVGPQADVWSIAAVLYEMLAGRPLFEGTNWHALAHAVLVAPVPRLSANAPWVPAPLAAVVQRGLERDRGRRFATMGLFLERLLDCEGLRDEQWYDALRRSHASTPDAAPPSWTVDDFDDEAATVIVGSNARTTEPNAPALDGQGGQVPRLDPGSRAQRARARPATHVYGTLLGATALALCGAIAVQHAPRRAPQTAAERVGVASHVVIPAPAVVPQPRTSAAPIRPAGPIVGSTTQPLQPREVDPPVEAASARPHSIPRSVQLIAHASAVRPHAAVAPRGSVDAPMSAPPSRSMQLSVPVLDPP